MTIRDKKEWTGLRERHSNAFGLLVGSMLVAATCPYFTVHPSLLGLGNSRGERSQFSACTEHLQSFLSFLLRRSPHWSGLFSVLFTIVSIQICPSSHPSVGTSRGQEECGLVSQFSHTATQGSSHCCAWEKGSLVSCFPPDVLIKCPLVLLFLKNSSICFSFRQHHFLIS